MTGSVSHHAFQSSQISSGYLRNNAVGSVLYFESVAIRLVEEYNFCEFEDI